MLIVILSTLTFLLIAFILAVCLLQSSPKWSVAQKVARTPDSRFANLTDYPFTPNYVDNLGYRIYYVDVGPKGGQTMLLMHGQPSWSYLYRHMIPLLVNQGFRVIAPDNVGFGKSV